MSPTKSSPNPSIHSFADDDSSYPPVPGLLYSPSSSSAFDANGLERTSSRASSTLGKLAHLKAARLSDEELRRSEGGNSRSGAAVGQGLRFWLIFSALACSCFLSALDLTAVSTALPSIAAEFDTTDASWIGSAYALTGTALIPWTGGLAHIFGRRPVLLASLAVVALGSALTGAGTSMMMVIAGRAVQGMGGGAVLTMTEIVVVDLVPIASRGHFLGLLAAVWALASSIGPPIGGALASAGQWRWLFYLNLPLSGLAMLLVAVFLDVKTPKTSWQEKKDSMDYVNLLFVAGSTAAILGLTWGGVQHPWTSYQVLVPLVLGFLSMAVFVYLERSHVKVPTLPYEILSNRTSLVGFITTFLHGVVVMFGVYFIPTYFQACFGDSPIMSGVHLFSLSFTVAPLAILTGVSIALLGHYRYQNIVGWVVLCVGFGLMTLLEESSSKAVWVPITVCLGVGAGIIFSATNFAVLAPLSPAQQPHGMALYGFFRSFGQVVGVAVGGTVLQNKLSQTLPAAFAAKFGGGSEIAFAAVPYIKILDEPLRTAVRTSFADSLRLLWQVGLGISCVALLLSLLIKSIALATTRDEENWGMEDRVELKEEKSFGGGEEKV